MTSSRLWRWEASAYYSGGSHILARVLTRGALEGSEGGVGSGVVKVGWEWCWEEAVSQGIQASLEAEKDKEVEAPGTLQKEPTS